MAVPLSLIISVECQFSCLCKSENFCYDFLCARSLNCNLSPVVGIIDHLHIIAFGLSENPLIILVNVGRIDYKQEMVWLELPVNQQVIHHASVRMKHHSVENFARLEAADFIGKNMIDEFLSVRSAHKNFSHVRHVEHSDRMTYSIVLLGYGGILYRHHKSGKRAHLGSESHVAVIQTGFLKIFFHYQVLIFYVLAYCCFRMDRNASVPRPAT